MNALSLVCLQDFPGFYESRLRNLIDYELENSFDWDNEQLESTTERLDHALGLIISKLKAIEPEWQLEPWAISEAFNEKASYRPMYLELSKLYVDSLNDVWEAEAGFKLGAIYESLTSPKEYNFTTDRLFVHIKTTKLAAMLQVLLRDNRPLLSSLISKRFTSRDGFSSFYSNTLTEWLDKPLASWDHNELGTLLNAYMVHMAGNEAEYDKIMESVVYEIDSGNNELGECIDAGINWGELWKSMNLELQETYDTILAEKLQDDPSFVPPALRCLETLELF